ncbi:MAG: hypothetical protein PHW75_02475 [Patescibacteria group bacterium]|nr:hypothetical protein [Patescibacteria group bacterium]
MTEQKNEYSKEAYELAQKEEDDARSEVDFSSPDSIRVTAEKVEAAQIKKADLINGAMTEAQGISEAEKQIAERYTQLVKARKKAEAAENDARAELDNFRQDKMGLGKTPERESQERTRETEITANVEFWKSLGIEVDPADVKQKIEALPEKEGFDFYLYLPRGIKTSKIISKIRERYPLWQYEPDEKIDSITSVRDATKMAYAVASRYQQECDADTLCKSATELEATGGTFMQLPEWLVAELRWHAENGTHLDEEGVTVAAGSRIADGYVPNAYWHRDIGKVSVGSLHPEGRGSVYGARRVVSSAPLES